MRWHRFWLIGLLTGAALPTHAGAQLEMRVSPAQASGPASLRVQVRIEPDEANRSLEIVAGADTFYRSSRIPLDGERAPGTVMVEFRDVPGGSYEVRGTLRTDVGRPRGQTRARVLVPGSTLDR